MSVKIQELLQILEQIEPDMRDAEDSVGKIKEKVPNAMLSQIFLIKEKIKDQKRKMNKRKMKKDVHIESVFTMASSRLYDHADERVNELFSFVTQTQKAGYSTESAKSPQINELEESIMSFYDHINEDIAGLEKQIRRLGKEKKSKPKISLYKISMLDQRIGYQSEKLKSIHETVANLESQFNKFVNSKKTQEESNMEAINTILKSKNTHKNAAPSQREQALSLKTAVEDMKRKLNGDLGSLTFYLNKFAKDKEITQEIIENLCTECEYIASSIDQSRDTVLDLIEKDSSFESMRMQYQNEIFKDHSASVSSLKELASLSYSLREKINNLAEALEAQKNLSDLPK